MRIALLCTNTGLKSQSLKRVAQGLTALLGYKVWRSTATKPKKKYFRYGDAVDKLQQYRWFQQQGLSALEFTTAKQEALDWLKEGFCVFGRKTLTGSSGAGIVVIEEPAQMVPCLVYTKYKPKKREFRVHIFRNEVVAIVEKRKRSDWNEASNPKIRNLANGYVFCQDVELTPELRTRIEVLGLAASKVCQSDFKGVDLAYNQKFDDLFVIEVNSAPGIEGTNVDKYVKAIQKYV